MMADWAMAVLASFPGSCAGEPGNKAKGVCSGLQ